MLVIVLSVPMNASANSIFSENFDGENGGVPQGNGYFDTLHPLSQWNILRGNVDLLGPDSMASGSFDLLRGHGLYLDLDGFWTPSNGGGGARLQTNKPIPLNPGEYTFSYSLASYNPAYNTVTVSLGEIYNQKVTLNGLTDFISFSHNFSVASPINVNIVFDQEGTDSVGLLLDTVSLESTAVPEPNSLYLFILGGVFAGCFRIKQKRCD